MSTFTESLLQSADEGNLENFQIEQPQAEEEAAPMPTVDQSVLEAVSQVNSEIETGKYIEGTAASIGTELGVGIGMQYLLNKYRPAMRFLRGASHVSKVGIVAPEGGSTVAGLVGLAATEALIWGGSNILGQYVRKSYGIQEEFSAGEAIAASVFGTTFIFDKVNKGVFALGRPAIGKETWKGRELVVNGVKTFVSGAALGIAESTLRQSTQMLLNERENFDEYDLLISGGIGGAMNTGMNTLFTAWSKTGSWGRGQAKQAVQNAKDILGKQKAELQETIKKSKQPVSDSVKYGFGGAYAQTGKDVGLDVAKKQLRDVEHAEEIIDDALNGIVKADESISAREKNPVPLKKAVVDDAPTVPKVKGFKTEGDPFEVGDLPDDIDFLKRGGKLTVMTPDEYIDMAIKADPKRSRKDIVNERLEDVEGMARNKEAIQNDAAPPLSVDRRADGTVTQEGLKRALAAKELGLTEVPVIVDASKFKADAPTPPKTPKGFEQTKVVDKEGKPAVVYHGSVEDFDEFDVSKMAQSDPDAPFNGFWFTSDKQEASPAFRNPRFIKEFFLDIKNPAPPDVYRELSKKHQGNELREELQKLGYDGVKWGGSELVPTKDPNKFIVKSPRMLPDEVGQRYLIKETASGFVASTGKHFEVESWNLYHGNEQDVGGYTSPEDFMKMSGSEETWVAFSPEQIKSASSKNLINETTFGRKADAPTPPKTPTKETPSDPDDDELNALIKRWESVDSETVSNEGVKVHRDAERLNERVHRRLGQSLLTLAKKKDDTEAVGSALDAVVTLRKLNSKLLDLSKTAGGRLVQGSRKDSNKYNWEGKFSHRALQEDDALNKLENSLRERLDGGEETDLSKLMKDYLGVKSEVKKSGEKIGKKKPAKELTPEQAAKKEAKEKDTLKKKLEKLQKRFGDDSKLKVKDVPKKKEADAEIKDLKARIKFHEANERDAIRLGERLKERERLLAVETGPLGAQRAEVSKKPTGPKKTSGQLEKVNADIAFLKKNMKNRVQEIDKAAKEITPEFHAEKIRKAHETKAARLEKELKQRRERFGDLEQARAKAGMPKLPEDPKIKDLEDRIEFYRDAEAEALKVVELEKELARVAELEGRGVMGDMRAETTPKPKGPTKPSRSAELREKIQQSKTRMKKRVADIDKAQAEINADQQRMEIYGNYREHFDAALNKDGINVITHGLNAIQLARQLALIDQLPSVFAGVGTNVLGAFKQFFRPVGSFLANVTLNQTGVSRAIRYAQADFFGAMKMLTDLKGLGTAVKRTFQQNLGATTRTVGKFSDEVSQTSLPRGEDALIAKAWNDSKRQAEAVENVGNVFGRWINSRNFWQILSLGIRGIQSVDEVFKRQIIKGRMWSEATKNGIRKFPNDPAKAEKYAKELYESAWRDNDGLAVLDDVSNFYDEINQVNEELLFASNVNRVEDVHEPFSEAIIRSLNKLSDGSRQETSPILGNLIRAFMPYIGVPIRGAYRLGHYSMPLFGVIKASVFNPYSSKIKRYSNQLKAAQDSLRKEVNPDRIKGLEDTIKELTEKVETAAARRAKYNSEALTDLLVGTGLFATGYLMASEGGLTGGLSWMTDDQKKKNKLKPYDALGVNYVANMPWSGPLALGADVSVWHTMKNAEDESGLPILQKDQDLVTTMRSSITSLLAEQPLTAGYKTGKELSTGTDEMVKNATAKLLSSYIPIPAQVRKITQTVTTDGTVDDLRGATFWERVAYHTLGTGPSSKKTNVLGELEESPRTFLTQNITRLAPRKEAVRTKLDEVLATDNYQQVSGKPTTLAPGIKMTEWRNEDGITLEYAFSLKLREVRIGKKTISEAVDSLLASKSFKKLYEKPPTQTLDGKFQNEGLKKLNDKLRDYYNRTKKELLKDERFMSSFVNKNDRNLLELYEQTGVKLDVGGKPKSVLELLSN